MQRLDTCRLKLGFELFPPSAASLFPDASLLNLSKIDREETIVSNFLLLVRHFHLAVTPRSHILLGNQGIPEICHCHLFSSEGLLTL